MTELDHMIALIDIRHAVENDADIFDLSDEDLALLDYPVLH